MYDDRCEIVSPGGMVDGSFIQDRDILNISSSRRNPTIADIFSRMKLMERRGSGLKKVVASYESHENYTDSMKVSFVSDTREFRVMLKNLNYKSPAVIKSDAGPAIETGDRPAIEMAIEQMMAGLPPKTRDQIKLIIEYALVNDSFRLNDIEALLDLKSSRTRELVSRMVSMDILISRGENRYRIYSLNLDRMDGLVTQ